MNKAISEMAKRDDGEVWERVPGKMQVFRAAGCRLHGLAHSSASETPRSVSSAWVGRCATQVASHAAEAAQVNKEVCRAPSTALRVRQLAGQVLEVV